MHMHGWFLFNSCSVNVYSAPKLAVLLPRSSSFISFFFFKKINRLYILNFREVLNWQKSWPESTESSHTALPSPPQSLPQPLLSTVSHISGTFVTINEPTSTPCYQAKSIVYIGFALKCCTFCGFGQMYNDMHPPLLCHTEQFHCLKNPLCSPFSSLLPHQRLATNPLFL